MTIRTRKILTLARLAVINDAWEKGKTLHDLADAHGVSVSVLKARLRYYLGLEKTGGGMPTVHPKALAARNKAAKENRLKEYHAALAALPLPECDSYGAKPWPYYAEWSHKTGATAGKRKGGQI